MGRRSDLVGGGLVRSAGGWTAVQSLRRSKERFASDERILGSSDFVSAVLKQANEQYEERPLFHARTIDMLVDVVCELLQIEKILLMSPAKKSRITRARCLIAHIGFHTLSVKGVDIDRVLNH